MTPIESTNWPSAIDLQPEWRAAGLPYFAANYYLRQRFGHRVQKISVDAGFTCPNVDGTVATGGCTFCDNRSFSPSRRLPRGGIAWQIDESMKRMRLRYKRCRHFLAYFQPATNTYAEVGRLRSLYAEALAHPHVVGLVIGTRPDCAPDNVLDLIEAMASTGLEFNDGRPPYVAVEYGMQTMHDRSLNWMNRGHHHDATIDAIERSRGRSFEIGVHIMLGLPGETHDDMLATAREVARLGVDTVKIHNLYCVKSTPLADQLARGEVRLLERAEYVKTVVDFIERLPPTMIVDRISGDAPPDYFIGPSWCLNKPAVKAAIWAEFARRQSSQGKHYWQPD
jgi:radical SAM protein (TIGR01212 family)